MKQVVFNLIGILQYCLSHDMPARSFSFDEKKKEKKKKELFSLAFEQGGRCNDAVDKHANLVQVLTKEMGFDLRFFFFFFFNLAAYLTEGVKPLNSQSSWILEVRTTGYCF